MADNESRLSRHQVANVLHAFFGFVELRLADNANRKMIMNLVNDAARDYLAELQMERER